MLKSLLFRLLRIVLTGIACSSPIYLQYIVIIPDGVILFCSFVAFAIAICVDAYRFSSIFWKKQDYYLGQLLPLGIYSAMGFLTCLIFPPIVFNRIFLPLRFVGCFGMKTMGSVVVVSIAIVLLATLLSWFGANAGRSNHNMFVRGNEDM